MTQTCHHPPTLTRSNRRGQTFELLLVFGVLIVLIQGFLLLSQKNSSSMEYGMVGDTALALAAAPAVTQSIQEQVHSAALLSLEEAMAELGRRGGIGVQEPCGISAGYSLWSTADKSLDQCVPALEESFSALFLQTLSKRQQPYQTGNGKRIAPAIHYDLSFRHTTRGMDLAGTTPEVLRIPLTDEQGALTSVIGWHPSFSLAIPDLHTELQQLSHGAKTILSACGSSPQPYECSKAQTYQFNTIPDAQLTWKTGPCAGDLAPNNPRTVSFCVQAPRKVLTQRPFGKTEFYPMLYKFALTLTPPAEVQVLSFSANKIPSSGSPSEKGGFGIASGNPIQYTGKVKSPSPEDLSISLCFSKASSSDSASAHSPACLPIPSTSWGTAPSDEHNIISIEGSLQPPVEPPFSLTMAAERKGRKDVTSGIDVVGEKPSPLMK